MIDDDLHISPTVPTRDADRVIQASRQRIDWSSTQLRVSDEITSRAREALRQSYARLARTKTAGSEPSSIP